MCLVLPNGGRCVVSPLKGRGDMKAALVVVVVVVAVVANDGFCKLAPMGRAL